MYRIQISSILRHSIRIAPFISLQLLEVSHSNSKHLSDNPMI